MLFLRAKGYVETRVEFARARVRPRLLPTPSSILAHAFDDTVL